jgi:hypothetical protein
MLFDSITFYEHKPAPDLLTAISPNEAYLLANPPKEYALYFPKGGEVELEIDQSKALDIQWLDILKSEWNQKANLKTGKTISIKTPDQLRAWAVLIKSK